MKLKNSLIGALTILSAFILFLLHAGRKWQKRTVELINKLRNAQARKRFQKFRNNEVRYLPFPVQRYLRKVMKNGQQLIDEVMIKHSGTFNMSNTGENWKPFTSNQHVSVAGNGFIWDARICAIPGLNVFVHDAYVEGDGILKASLMGMFSLADMPQTPELAHGELMRFLAEVAWYPTALLPGQSIKWRKCGPDKAKAIISDRETSVALTFCFNAEGFIETVISDGRHRESNGRLVLTPWQGRFWNYQERNGIMVPLDGEVSWILPEGLKPYWRGHIDEISFKFVEPQHKIHPVGPEFESQPQNPSLI